VHQHLINCSHHTQVPLKRVLIPRVDLFRPPTEDLAEFIITIETFAVVYPCTVADVTPAERESQAAKANAMEYPPRSSLEEVDVVNVPAMREAQSMHRRGAQPMYRREAAQ
jgi:hypothetical protein